MGILRAHAQKENSLSWDNNDEAPRVDNVSDAQLI